MKPEALIWTEGKTDWQHIKTALNALNVGPRISVHESTEDFGDDQLLKQCTALARVPQLIPTIFIFDRDNSEILTRIEDQGSKYKCWGNNVYSFAIPVPTHRQGQSSVCIEFYYSDEELRTLDSAGRRLFLSTEFNVASGRHLSDKRLSFANKKKLGTAGSVPRIVDSDVYDDVSQNVALSKADFARNVMTGTATFASFGFGAFREIFNVVDNIIGEARERIDLPFGDLDQFLTRLDGLDAPHQLGAVLEVALRLCKLAAITFGAVSFRFYEARILKETPEDAKKVRPLKQILTESFGHPSLSTLHRLARHSYFLVDDHAPTSLCTLRAMMASNPVLGPVGELLDRIELASPSARQGRILNKAQLRKPVLDYLLPEFAKYEGRISEVVENAAGTQALEGLSSSTWKTILESLVDVFAPLRALPLSIRTIQRVRANTDDFDVLVTTYRSGAKSSKQLVQTYNDLSDDRLDRYELLGEREDEAELDVFPFLVIRDDRLLYYTRTRAQGYEYRSVFEDDAYVFPTKRKFSHLALREMISADLQGLFWTQVQPSTSSTGVKANFPPHGSIVGRKQQIATIMDEVIEIVNQNGIIYGPGGVGKTALLLELSRQLFEAPVELYFENLIWVSAKRDLYDATLDAVESRSPQFRTLDNVLTAILEFHSFEDASSYDLEFKKWLVLELLRDHKTLLILDNFESVAKAGQKDILEFFGVESKKYLRNKPDHLKVIITSRELVPSGFHQIQLRGLDKRESKELMEYLDEQYKQSGNATLTAEQRDAMYEVTRGIPLIIKHSYGQIYEFNRPPDQVLRTLTNAGTRVVEFSFAELFQNLRQDEIQLRTLLLLELIGKPLMARQIADIFEIEEGVVTDRLSRLLNFQCISRSAAGTEDKFIISDDVRLFTRRLSQEYADVATAIKGQIAKLSMEKRMDYSQEEFDAFTVFQAYIGQGHYVLAQDFINERLKRSPGSLLLNLHYARYLKETKRRTGEAIERLERIRVPSGNDQQVLRLLMEYYTALEFPNFEQAHTYARELEDVATYSDQVKLELARFYVTWSTALKMRFELDPLKEMLRQQKYKELADTAIKLILTLPEKTYASHHLLAQSYFNRWDYESALPHAEKALSRLPKGSNLAGSYRRLRTEIMKKRMQYSRQH